MTSTLLDNLWLASCLMGVISISAILVVIVRRAFLSTVAFSEAELHDSVLQALMTDWTIVDAELVRKFLKRGRRVAHLVTEFSALVRGPELTRGLELLDRSGAVDELLYLLKRGNREDKLAACDALSLFTSEVASDRLKGVAKRAGSRRLRIAALRALIEMGGQPSIADVIQWMRLTDAEIPAEASTVLMLSTRLHTAEALARIVSGVDRPPIRAALVWAIGEAGIYEAIPVLAEMAFHNNPRIRIAALHAIGEMGFMTDRTVLQYCLADGIFEVRAEAAVAIGKTGDLSAIGMLAVLLDDPEWDVRFRVANALVDLGDAGVEELRAAAAGSNEPSRRARTAAMVMSERRVA